ncbi:MAG TPA: phosphoadenosine phosphosulfate reductase [Fibrobacteria bacterium]|nr:phosphoadenosine phosphosulfate reductase [Fibrobacteria bacterium]
MHFTSIESDLTQANEELETRHPREILAWAFQNLRDVVVTTAWQPGGIVILDLLHDLGLRPPVIFVDTLFQFPETLELASKLQARYDLDLRVYKPAGLETESDFIARHGEALWDRDLDLYQELTKVEPLRRAMRETGARAWISGRRRDQGGERSELAILERAGERIKVNPLATWTRKEIWGHILSNGIPYNPLHDQGYPSIGDWPLTDKADADQGERSGRWKGRGKTECGIHTSL